MHMPLPEPVRAVLQRLEENGYAAYVVGGAVRDWLLHRAPGDFDVATSAQLPQVCRLFPRAVPTGAAFGTVTLPTGLGGLQVTTFRREEGYADRRRPDRVEPVGDLREDLMRRDFTVNTFCCDAKGAVLDLLGAREDLQNRLLRAVGEPGRRFEEDALRILRAYRFAAQLGFAIEEQTQAAARRRLGLLEALSRERIAQELDGILLSREPARAAPLFDAGGLAFLGIPAGARLDRLEGLEAAAPVRYGWFFHYNRLPAGRIMEALKFSNARKRELSHMVELWGQPLPEGDAALKRALQRVGERSLLAFLRGAGQAGAADTAPQQAALRRIVQAGEPYLTAHLCLNGAEIARLGRLQGRAIGEMQRRLLEEVIERPQLNTPRALRALVERWAGGEEPGGR